MTHNEIFNIASDSAREFSATHNLTPEEENFLFHFTFITTSAADAGLTVDQKYMVNVLRYLFKKQTAPLSDSAVEYCRVRIETFPDFVTARRKAQAAEVVAEFFQQ